MLKTEDLQELHAKSFAWALHCCYQNRTDAEEVLQQVYLKIMEGKAVYSGNAVLKTWLFAVIRNTAVDFYRRKKRKWTWLSVEAIQEPYEHNNIEQKIDREQQAQFLLAALDQLSDRQREVLHLVFYQDLSLGQAAAIMEVSIGSVRTHYERGKARLRKLLGNTVKDIFE